MDGSPPLTWGRGVEGWLGAGMLGPALMRRWTSSVDVALSLARVEAKLERIWECKSNSSLAGTMIDVEV